MHILVINGSPKSEQSVTWQFVTWLERRFSGHRFEHLHVARLLPSLERDAEAVGEVIGRLAGADAVLWATPVYYFLVPAQLKRFIELIGRHPDAGRLIGGRATALTTSIHFYDHTAHEYLQAVSEDLGLHYLEGFSAAMYDLLSAKKRRGLEAFFLEFFDSAAEDRPLPRRFAPLSPGRLAYRPGRVRPGAAESGRRAVLISDADEGDGNLARMEAVFAAAWPGTLERISLADLKMHGACLGCLRCGWDGACVYRDGFSQVYRERILTADALIFSGAVRDRYLSARFKRFFDRSFFLGHRPEQMGKQVVWLVSGPLGQLSTLRQIIEAHTQLMGTHLVAVISDEVERSAELTALLKSAAGRLGRDLERDAARPQTFLGVGGKLLFRDFVYLSTAVFQADHRFYRRHGVYDFPQRKLGPWAFDRVLALAMHLPPLRKRIQREMIPLMLRPFARILSKPSDEGTGS